MGKSFLDNIAKVADRAIQQSIREAEKERKRRTREQLKEKKKQLKAQEQAHKKVEREQLKYHKEEARRLEAQEKHANKINTLLIDATTYLESNNVSKAIISFNKVLAMDLYNKNAYLGLMNLYRETKDYENEENIIVKALRYYSYNEDYKKRLIEVAKILTADKKQI